MADWTLSSGSKIRPYRSHFGATPTRHFEESTAAGTAVIVRGDIVCSDTKVTTGGFRVLRAPSSGGTGTNLMQVGIKSLIGVALGNSTGDGSTTGIVADGLWGRTSNRRIAVAIAHPDVEFIGFNSTNETGNGVATQLLVGANRAITYDRAAHVFCIASTNSTETLAAVTITEIPADVIGDTGAFPMIFRFLSTNVSLVVGGSAAPST